MKEPAPTAEGLLRLLAEADNNVATKTGELKQAKDEYGALADRVMALLDEQGLSEMGAPKAGLKVSITESEQYSISDYVALEKFLLRHKALELLQRRLSPAVVRDMIIARKGVAIPGVKPYTIRRLSVTKSKGAK